MCNCCGRCSPMPTRHDRDAVRDNDALPMSLTGYNAASMTSLIASPAPPNHRESVADLTGWLTEQVIGQERLANRLLISLFSGGHLLVEGVPGLAKTRAIKVLSEALEGNFHRIQFTPDLLPSDITGTEIFRPESGSFSFRKGPVFHNLLLADEINRAPAKVQSALLEAMAERQVSVGRDTYPLPDLFLVMATQNPIEQEGVYPLPEAQLDRFLMHVTVGYPDAEAELGILDMVRQEDRLQAEKKVPPVMCQDDIFAIRNEILDLHMASSVEGYIIQLVIATRQPENFGDKLGKWLELGASPRGTIALDRCARAHAWLAGRAYVTPEDVQNVCSDVLRHRIIPSFEAEAEGYTRDHILTELLAQVPVV